MKTIRLFILFVSAGSVLLARDLPDVNRQQLLSDLERMEKDRHQTWEAGLKKVMAEIASAAASPQAAVRLYQEAVKATQAGDSEADRRGKNTRKQQEDVTTTATFRSGMQYRLRFMEMLLRASSGEEIDALFPDVERYVNGILADKKLMEDRQARQIWGAAINASDPIVQMFRIEPYLKGGRELGANPAGVEHIIDGVLMPHYREKKDPKLLTCWDQRIERERDRVDEAGLDMGRDRFNSEEMPRLLWNRAKDFAAVEEPNRAISEMFGLIRQNPGHPDFEKWVGELKEQLQGK